MRALVTGAAGFIGSHLVDQLLAAGHEVVGVDCFTENYDQGAKRANLEDARTSALFVIEERDLAVDALEPLLDGIDVIFHVAAQPGVRASWGTGFEPYVRRNVIATQRLLEASHERGVARLVNSSSSSVYGNAERCPTSELDLPAPVSPYGVTKLAAEHLATLYATNFGVHTVSLRYFTVYGPRQRPDMAMHRMIEAALGGAPFPLNGDGSQVRDFTFVHDAVRANLAAATSDVRPGSVFNIGGGSMTPLGDVLSTVEELTGHRVPLDCHPAAAGDPARTGADTTRAAAELGWHPEVPIGEGLARQVAWHRARAR
jgi:UDP-glucuronate 4-epimerase